MLPLASPLGNYHQIVAGENIDQFVGLRSAIFSRDFK